jgi:hypothetical protein
LLFYWLFFVLRSGKAFQAVSDPRLRKAMSLSTSHAMWAREFPQMSSAYGGFLDSDLTPRRKGAKAQGF